MKTTIDAAGRVVVPKALPKLTDDIVRDTLEKTRR
jgi:bifunctional DNA-binding transcriptional regulator/antitoxin component of YhaV-PrlF toxin-antitoxin module